MPEKIKVRVGEEEHEVDLEALELPEGYSVLPPGEVPKGLYTKDTLDATVNESWKKKFNKLKSDPVEARAILEAHGVPLNEDGEVSIPEAEDIDLDAERERIKAAYERDRVKPLEEENKQLRSQHQRFLENRQTSEILQAAAQNEVDDWALKIPTDDPSAQPPIVHMIKPYLGYDGEHDMFAVRDGDSFAPATKEGKPWADITDLFGRLKKNKAYAHLFKDTRPRSSNYNGGTSTEGGDAPKKNRSKMSVDEKTAYINEFGREAFDALPK